MSYCSRIYIINKMGDYGHVIASYDSGVLFTNYMSYSDMFNRQIDFRAYMDDGNTEIYYDKYNSICCYCDAKDFLAWIRKMIAFEKSLGNTGIGFKPIYKFIKALKKCYKKSDLVILHYGY